ncbi:outer membrane protein [Geothrix oryzisoli]|uniref:outer membrane protein n=1 Tax=Geothrix oryzisoli TaxID=2922721 RepID=UPI001FAB8031|nr:outer membrane beta-barrel protein [Geothrix oryzisoli]
MNLSKHLLTALLIAGTAGAASAQSANWTGFYLGANVGYGFGKSDVTTSTVFSPTGYFATASIPQIQDSGAGHVSPKGFAGGLTFGYNAQSGTTVYGFEIDAGTFGLKGDRTAGSAYAVAPTTSYSLKETTKADYLATLRGRIGYADNRNLWFGTAGLALTSIKIEDTFSDTFATAAESVSKSKSKVGWALGAGYEYAAPDQWTFKAEILYVDFGKVSVDGSTLTAFTPAIAFPTNTFTHTANLKAEVVRIGFNYRF